MRRHFTVPLLGLVAIPFLLSGCAEESGSVPEVPATELIAEVPELEAVHEFMQPLWHDAFPAKDYELIQELVPQIEPTLTALDAVELPGILRDKVERWNEGKVALAEAFQGLKTAADSGDEAGMLGYAETFHMVYESLVRLIRPPLPELEAVHQHLYGLYHHYGPGYDLERIAEAVTELAATIPALRAAELPSRVADKQTLFDSSVDGLERAVAALVNTLEDPNRAEVDAAIDAVHTAYEEVEGVFSADSHD
jgi:hypothetical protein